MDLIYKWDFSTKLIIVTALTWMFWDIYAYLYKKKTISRVFTEKSFYSPMIPFIVGVLCGHFFWVAQVCR